MTMTADQKKEFYGETAKEWLERWDRGDTVWSVEMGGLGPAYEQAIQITIAEIIRILLDQGFDPKDWEQDKMGQTPGWERDSKIIEELSFKNANIKKLGLSGAQWGAALGVAVRFYRDGPYTSLTHPSLEADRRIQVSKEFPNAE